MKIVQFGVLVHGWPWGWGSKGNIERGGICRICGPRRYTKKQQAQGLGGILQYAGGVQLCSECARRMIHRAFVRPLDDEELSAVRASRACVAVPMEDHLAQLYQ